MYFKTLYFLFFLSFTSLHAQKEANNWYFGDMAGITFNTTPPTALTKSQMFTNEGCASISAPNGRLLFYTDGLDVWDSTHRIMPNGSGLNGDATSTQSAIIVPKPGNPKIYYIFTVAPEAIKDGLQYSEVNMSLNSGKGDVVSTRKNIKLKSQMCEKITAIQKKNSNDILVLAARFYSDSFFAFSVTSSGVVFTPVSYRTGFNLFGPGTNAIGYLKISPNGKKVAFANSTFDTSAIGDFDAYTGKISNIWKFYSPNGYGIEFSPNSKYLYTTETGNYKVFRYDAVAPTRSAFLASVKIIDNSYTFSPSALQLGPDGKIYISMINGQYLSVIHNPDDLNCNPQKDYIYLGGKYARYGLPSFIQSFFQDTGILVTRKCTGDSTTFSIPDNFAIDSVRWNFDDPGSGKNNTSTKTTGSFHIYNKTGYYNVKLTIYYNSSPVNMRVKFYVGRPVKPILGRDTVICNSFNLTLQPQKDFKNYLWSPGNSTLKSINVSQKGTYILNAKDSGDCWSADTISVNNPKITAQLKLSDTADCLAGNLFNFKDISIYNDNKRLNSILYLGDNTTTSDSFFNKSYIRPGIYSLKLVVKSDLNCTDSITKKIVLFPGTKVFIGKDTIFCGKFSHSLNAGNGFKQCNWSTGEIALQINVKDKGTYYADAVDLDGCPSRDTIKIGLIVGPVIKVSYDSVNCKFVYLTVDSIPGATYLWGTGETVKKISVIKKGWYTVTANHKICNNSDSILIENLPTPEVNLGPDTSLCTHEIILKTKEKGSYLWNTMEIRPSIIIDSLGKYWLTVSRNNCSATDTVNVKLCEDMLYYLPDIFTPNDDNTNDVFRVHGSFIVHIKMEIFNRWGQKLLDVSGKDVFWDGTFSNAICLDGIYFYKITVLGKRAGSERSVKGRVMLIR